MDKIIPVVTIKETEQTEEILSSLIKGGINCAEITFRTACAKDAIKLGVQKFPDMNIGAGTVINLNQCKEAIKAGAKFIVSPGLSEEVAKYCNKKGIRYLPGCVTPTEIIKALELGITTVKFFPANVYGGIKAMKALSGPFPQIKFVPTGGIDLTNLKETLDQPFVEAVGGSFMTKGDIVANCMEIDKVIKGE